MARTVFSLLCVIFICSYFIVSALCLGKGTAVPSELRLVLYVVLIFMLIDSIWDLACSLHRYFKT